METRLSTAEVPAHHSSPVPETDAIGRSALRKASLRLLPLIGIGYLIAYMDRVNVSFAALQMNRALHFSAAAYGLGAGLFFLTYVAFEVPSNLLLVRFGARRWLARIMFTWGLVSIAMMFVRTPWQFYLVRLALGAAEAGFFPGVIFYLTLWFPSEKRAQAISHFYIAYPLSTVVMGGLAGLLLNLNGTFRLAGWQWLFLIEGLPAIVMSLLFLLCLPDGPQKAAWLTSDERSWILRELQSEADASAHATGDERIFVRVFSEPRLWLLTGFYLCIMLDSYAYAFIAPTVIQNITTFSAAKIGYVIAFFGILGTISMLVFGWHSDRAHEHHLHSFVPMLAAAAAFLAVGVSARPAVVLPAFAIIVMASCAYTCPFWSISSSFLSGKSAAIGIATINSIGLIGGFIGPSWMGFTHNLTGTYQRGLLTLTIPALAAGVIILFARRYSNSHTAQME
jgi:MFS transporter, ACS family, tartrate transporter